MEIVSLEHYCLWRVTAIYVGAIAHLHPIPVMFFNGRPAAPAPELLLGWVPGKGMYPGAGGCCPACWCSHGCSTVEPSVPRQC